MFTGIPDKKYYFIYASFIFLTLGLMTSPTVIAGHHILIFIPALLLLLKNKKEFLPKLPKSSMMLIGLSLWGIISAIYNHETLYKPFKSYQDIKYYLFGVLCIYPFVYFINFNASKRHFRILLNILCLTIIVAFLVGVSKAYLQFDPVKMKFGDFHIRSGGFVHYMRYGYASSLLALVGLGMHFNREKLKDYINPKFFYPALVLSFCAIGTSQCRGALLGMLVGLPFLLFKYKPKLAKIMTAMGTVFIAIIIYFSFISKSTTFRFLNVNQGSNSVRVSQWVAALKVIQEKPILGLGPDQFSYNVKPIKEKYNIWAQHFSGHAHNITLEHAANYGLVGLGFFIAFFIFWFVEMYKFKGDFSWVIMSYILAFFIAGQVEVLFDVINSHLLFFIYSISQAIQQNPLQVRK